MIRGDRATLCVGPSPGHYFFLLESSIFSPAFWMSWPTPRTVLQPASTKATASRMAIASLLVLAACNTFQGLGKDVQKAGETIENAARRK